MQLMFQVLGNPASIMHMVFELFSMNIEVRNYLLRDKKAWPHLNLPSNKFAVSSSPLLKQMMETAILDERHNL